MTDLQLQEINDERRRRGLPPITRERARASLEARFGRVATNAYPMNDGSMLGSQMNDFLFSLSTGVMLPSAGGIIGGAAHQHDTSSPPPPPPPPSYDAPPPPPPPNPSPSYDSGGSNSGTGGLC